MLNRGFYKTDYENKEVYVKPVKVVNIKGHDIKLYKILKPSNDATSEYFNFYRDKTVEEDILNIEQVSYLLKDGKMELKIMAVDYVVETDVMNFLIKESKAYNGETEAVNIILNSLGVTDIVISGLGEKMEDGTYKKMIFDSTDKFDVFYKIIK